MAATSVRFFPLACPCNQPMVAASAANQTGSEAWPEDEGMAHPVDLRPRAKSLSRA
jgi:hypothetical protein